MSTETAIFIAKKVVEFYE